MAEIEREKSMTKKIAVLDDYQGVALAMADWTTVQARADVEVFRDTIADPDRLVAQLLPFDALCVMRERTPLPRAIIERLPNLRLIVSTGNRNASIDAVAAEERRIPILHVPNTSAAAIELTWALILAAARNLVDEAVSLQNGGWQKHVGMGLRGKTLGVLGLGKIGADVAQIGRAFGMKIIAWSENLTAERAEQAGAALVSKQDLFSGADILTVHLVLGDRSRGLVDADMLSLMKPQAILVNTSRGPIVREEALIAALQAGTIAAAALDVYDIEPLPADHPYRRMPNVIATPHIGYVSNDAYEVFYRGTVEHLIAWLDGEAA